MHFPTIDFQGTLDPNPFVGSCFTSTRLRVDFATVKVEPRGASLEPYFFDEIYWLFNRGPYKGAYCKAHIVV